MGRIYRAVIPTKRGLRRSPARGGWFVGYPSGTEFWGGVFRDLGLAHDTSDPRIGGGPALPHIIAGKDFIAAREALPRLSSDAEFCAQRNGFIGQELRLRVLALFTTRNAVALVSEYVDLRGATLEELESGKTRTR